MTISRVFPQPLRPLRPIRFHPEGAACRGEAQFGFAHGSTSLSVPEQRRSVSLSKGRLAPTGSTLWVKPDGA